MTTGVPSEGVAWPLDKAQLEAIADHLAHLVLARLERAAPLRQARLAPCDRAALEVLLPAMWTPCGVSLFSMSELIAHSIDRPDLAEAIERATSVAPGGAGKRLGKLFRRAAGFTVDGLQIYRVGESRGVALWQLGFTPTASAGLEKVSNPPKPS